jgi:hypothetical protein
VPWRGNAQVDDVIPGGWYDAGDFLKLNFPLGTSVSFLAWAMVEFPASFSAADSLAGARDALRVPLNYLLKCYDASRKRYTGQIGLAKLDHAYWGRPEEMDVERPAFVWDSTMRASDLLCSTAAAFASSSLAFKASDPAYAAALLSKAKSIYAWALTKQGRYSDYNKDAVASVYPSSDYLDDQSWAAGWLYRATGDRKYLYHAESFWKRSYGKNRYAADM